MILDERNGPGTRKFTPSLDFVHVYGNGKVQRERDEQFCIQVGTRHMMADLHKLITRKQINEARIFDEFGRDDLARN